MDGCDSRYLKLSDIPNLKRMMQSGMYREGHSVMPSVTRTRPPPGGRLADSAQ